jgi:outer membrane protein
MKRLSRQGLRFSAAGAILLSAGCASPVGSDDSSGAIRHSLAELIRREFDDASTAPDPRRVSRGGDVDTLGIPSRTLRELDSLAGPQTYPDLAPPPHTDLLGRTSRRTVRVSLERVVRTAAERNLSLQFARLAPAVSEAQVVQAEAAFDWVLFSNLDWQNTDSPQPTQAVGAVTFGVGVDQRSVVNSTTGLRRQLASGGVLTVQQELIYSDVSTPGLNLSPDPSWGANATVQLDQPLLRNFGTDVALAQVRLSRNAERSAVAELETNLISTLTDVESAYWDLVRATYDVLILQRLVDESTRIREQVRARFAAQLATQAELADAIARVERQKGNVIRAHNALAAASDRVKLLMNDPELTVGSEVLLVPADLPIDEPVRLSLHDSIAAAMERRPEIRRAILSIDDTSIRQRVADNARLPQLNLRLQAQTSDLNDNLADAWEDQWDTRFVDYLVGLRFEQPVGNRAAEAAYRQRGLERAQATIAFENTVRQVIAAVKTALRNVETNYELIAQTRLARVSASENLRSFRVQLELTETMDVQQLNLLLNRLELVAQAERDEIVAAVDYMKALADLNASVGTTLERSRIELVVPDAAEALSRSSPWWTRRDQPR